MAATDASVVLSNCILGPFHLENVSESMLYLWVRNNSICFMSLVFVIPVDLVYSSES